MCIIVLQKIILFITKTNSKRVSYYLIIFYTCQLNSTFDQYSNFLLVDIEANAKGLLTIQNVLIENYFTELEIDDR